jgi:hypothetical protein
MNEMLILFGIAAVFGLLSAVKHREEVITEQALEDMKVDHLQTCNMLIYVNRNDAERHIDAFYGRWSGRVDEWELSNRTAALYKRLFDIQKAKANIDPSKH